MGIIICAVLLILILASGCTGTQGTETQTASGDNSSGSASGVSATNITLHSYAMDYPTYVAAPLSGGPYPGLVLIHSFNGLEPGYLTLSDKIASAGYVVIAPRWQTFNASPSDEEVGSLIRSGIGYLKIRPDVDSSKLGLTGFCAGGRYTMLFLPQIKDFKAGVAWYGFPYNPGFANETRPVDYISSLSAPLLMIHGSADMASPITTIFNYSVSLTDAHKYFELKVYEGLPHGFMVQNGTLNESDSARDALREMLTFFNRTLKGD